MIQSPTTVNSYAGTDKILIVIPCLNEEETIERLVAYIIKDALVYPLTIVIADGGSTDQTIPIAKRLAGEYPNVVYLANPKRIQSAALNRAVTTYGLDAQYLIRLDAHADYPAGYCQSLIEEARVSQAASVVVTMKTMGKGGFQDAVAAAQNSKLGNGGSSHRNLAAEGKWVDHGHHALMRIDAFKAVGGYDEHFSHNEDAELDMRLRKAGYTIWLTDKTFLTYYPRSSPVALFRQYFNYGQGRFRNLAKHKTGLKIRQLLPVAIAPLVMFTIIAAPLSGIMALPALLWAIICLGYGALLAVQEQNPTLLLSGFAIMIMHFAWSLGFWKGAWQSTRVDYRE